MATLRNNIVWATNSDELAKELKKGLDAIVATEAATNKLVQSLSGDKLIAAAHRSVAAITEIGGASKLTASEAERNFSIIERAIKKLELQSKTVPTAMLAMRDSLKAVADTGEKTNTFFGKMGEVVRLNVPVVGGLSAKFTENAATLGVIGGVIGGVIIGYELLKKAIDIGSAVAESSKNLRNLSVETGIGVERLQQISSVTRDYGVDTAELGKGIYQLSRRIAGDDASASAALGVMGLNIQNLKKLAPDEMFLTIMRAVNQIPDPLTRSAVAAQLFGSRFAQAFLAIGPDLDHLVEKAKASGEFMSKDAVEGAARFSDSIDHLSLRLKALAGEGLAPALDYVSRLIDGLRSGEINKLHALLTISSPGLLAVSAYNSLTGGTKPTREQVESQLGPMAPAVSHGGATPISAEDQAAMLAMTNTLKTLRAQIVPLTAEQNAWLVSLAAIGPEFLTTANLLGTKITPQQLETWKDALKIQQEMVAARAAAAKDNATADAMETDGLQNAISTRIAALDAEHKARVTGISLEIESDKKKNADLTAENLTYQAKRRLIVAEGTAAVLEIERASDEEIAKLNAANKTKSLADQLAAIDQEVYQQQQAALKKVGYTDSEWKAEYAIFLAGEARKQNLIDASNKKEFDAEAKLRAEIAGLDLEADKTGLARTVSMIDAKERLEIAALDAEVLTDEQHQARLSLIDEKYTKERGNARLANEREIGKELLKVQQETEDATINLFLDGMQRELALNETKRRRVLDQIHLEGKDQGQAGAALVAETNALFEAQARGIVARFDPIAKAWKALNADLRQEWADTWTKALDGTGSFVDALLSPFNQLEKEWVALLGAMAADWESKFIAKLTGLNLGGPSGMPGGGVSLSSLFGGGPGFAEGSQGSFNADTGDFESSGPSGIGAGMGSAMTMGISAAIAIGAPLLINALKKLFGDHKADDIARDAGEKFGTKFSKATSDAILADAKTGLTEVAAELNNLDKIIEDAGGITAQNVDRMTARFHDLFSMLQTGQLTAAQVNKQLTAGFPALAAAATDATGRWSDGLKEIMRLDRQAGLGTQAITDALKAQGVTLGTSFNAAAAALVDDKDSLASLGAQAVRTFAIMVASGSTTAEAMAAISPGLASLRQSFADLGIDVEDVGLNSLLMQDSINKGNPQLIAGINGLASEFVALDNLGAMNVDQLSAMEAQGMAMYTRLQAGVAALGGSTKDALEPMQGFLHQAVIEAEKLGVPLDANTQMLVDQSKEAGIWQDAITPQDKLLGGMQSLIDKVSELIDRLNGIPKKVDTTVTTTYDTSGSPVGPDNNNFREPQPIMMAAGGFFRVTKPTMFIAGENPGGEDVAFSGVGQKFPQTSDMPSLIPDGLQSASPWDDFSAAARAGGSLLAKQSNPTIVLQEQFTFAPAVSTLDPIGTQEVMEKKLMPAFMTVIEDRRRGYAGRLKKVMTETNG